MTPGMDSFTSHAAFGSHPHRKSPLQVHLTADERRLTRELAAREGVSASELMRQLLAKHMHSRQREDIAA